MDLNERIKLDKQTVKTLERIRDNGGNVPDGYVAECSDGGEWRAAFPVEQYGGSWWFRLTPIKPPRFTVSTDPCGVLDSERPGWIAWFVDGVPAARSASDRLNAGIVENDDYTWSPLPKPQIPLGPEDVPPGSVLRLAKVGWLSIAECTDEGVTVNSLSPDTMEWPILMMDDWQILRPGSTDWQPCSKDAT